MVAAPRLERAEGGLGQGLDADHQVGLEQGASLTSTPAAAYASSGTRAGRPASGSTAIS